MAETTDKITELFGLLPKGSFKDESELRSYVTDEATLKEVYGLMPKEYFKDEPEYMGYFGDAVKKKELSSVDAFTSASGKEDIPFLGQSGKNITSTSENEPPKPKDRETTAIGDVLRSLKSGSIRAAGGVVAAPQFFNRTLTAFTIRPFLKAQGATDEEANMAIDALQSTTPAGMVMAGGAQLQEGLNKAAAKTEEKIFPLEGGIAENIIKGNVGVAGEQLMRGIFQSAPYLAMTMATAGAGSAAVLGVIGSTAAAQQYAETKGKSEGKRILNGWMYGSLEAAGELVTAGIVNGIGRAFKAGVIKEVKKEFVKGAAKQIAIDFGLEGMSEGMTQLGQNITDIITGVDPNRRIFDGVLDAIIIGGASGGGLGGAHVGASILGRSLASDKEVTQVQENANQQKVLIDQIETTDSDPVKEALEKRVMDLKVESDEVMDANYELAKRLPTETKTEVAGLYAAWNDLQAAIDGKELSKEEIPATEKAIEGIKDQIQTIKEDFIALEEAMAEEKPAPKEEVKAEEKPLQPEVVPVVEEVKPQPKEVVEEKPKAETPVVEEVKPEVKAEEPVIEEVKQETEVAVTKKLDKQSAIKNDKIFKEQKNKLLDDLIQAEDILLGKSKDETRKMEAELTKNDMSQDQIDTRIRDQYERDYTQLQPEMLKKLNKLGIRVKDGKLVVDIYKDGTVEVGDIRSALRIIDKEFPARIKTKSSLEGPQKARPSKYRQIAESYGSLEESVRRGKMAEENLATATKSGNKGLQRVMQEQLDEANAIHKEAKKVNYEKLAKEKKMNFDKEFNALWDKNKGQFEFDNIYREQLYDLMEKQGRPAKLTYETVRPLVIKDKLETEKKTIPEKKKELNDKLRDLNLELSEKFSRKDGKGLKTPKNRSDSWKLSSLQNQIKHTEIELADLKRYEPEIKKLQGEKVEEKKQDISDNIAENKYYTNNLDGNGFKEEPTARPVTLEHEGEYFSVKNERGYKVFEARTGTRVGEGKTLKEAIADGDARITKFTSAKYPQEFYINSQVEKTGLSPRYKNETKPNEKQVNEPGTTTGKAEGDKLSTGTEAGKGGVVKEGEAKPGAEPEKVKTDDIINRYKGSGLNDKEAITVDEAYRMETNEGKFPVSFKTADVKKVMPNLLSKGLIHKPTLDNTGVIRLTDKGKALAEKYQSKVETPIKAEAKITDKDLNDLFPDNIVSVKLKDGTTQEMSFRGWDKGKAIVYNRKVGQFPVEKSDIVGVTKKARQVETPIVEEGFTPKEVINKGYADIKAKIGEKKAQKYFEQVDRLFNPNKTTIVEYRYNGVVTKEGDKYIFHALGDMERKTWRDAWQKDITDQFVKPIVEGKEIKPEVKQEEKDITDTFGIEPNGDINPYLFKVNNYFDKIGSGIKVVVGNISDINRSLRRLIRLNDILKDPVIQNTIDYIQSATTLYEEAMRLVPDRGAKREELIQQKIADISKGKDYADVFAKGKAARDQILENHKQWGKEFSFDLRSITALKQAINKTADEIQKKYGTLKNINDAEKQLALGVKQEAPVKEAPTEKSKLYTEAEKIIAETNKSKLIPELYDLINKSKSEADLKELLELPYVKSHQEATIEVNSRLRYLERHPEVAENKAEQLKAKEEELKNRLGNELEDLMSSIGGIKEFTGEQRVRVVDALVKVMKTMGEITLLKGEQLWEKVKQEIKARGWVIPDDVFKEAQDKYTSSNEVKPPEPEKVTPPKKTVKEKETEPTEREKSLLNRMHDAENLSEEFKKAIEGKGLTYEQISNDATAEEVDYLIADRGLEGSEKDVFNTKNNIEPRIRALAATRIIKALDTLAENATSPKEEAGYRLRSVEMADFIDETARDWGRGIQILGSAEVNAMLSPKTQVVRIKREVRRQRDEQIKSNKPDINNKAEAMRKANKESIGDALASKVYEKAKQGVTGRASTSPARDVKVSPDVIKREREFRKPHWDALKQSFKKPGGTLSSSILPLSAEQASEISILIGSYVREGVYRTEKLVARLKNDFKKLLDIDLSDEDATAMLPKKVEGKALEELQQEGEEIEASTLLANRVLNMLKDPKVPKDDPLRQMVETLFGKVQEKDTKEKVKPVKKTDAEKIKEALENKAEYADVWEAAKEEVKDRIEANEALSDLQKEEYNERLDAFYDEVIGKPFSEKQAKGATKQAMKDLDISIDKVIKDHYTVYDATKRTLQEKLIEDLGLEGSDAKMLADAVGKEFDKIAIERKRSILKRGVTTKEVVKPKQARQVHDKLIELTNLGAFSDSEFAEAYADKWGFPKLEPYQVKEMERLSKLVHDAPEGYHKFERIQDFLAYTENIKGIDMGDVGMSMWYSSILSGYRTQSKNFVQNSITSLFEGAVSTIRHPLYANRLVEGLIRGWGEGVRQFGHIMKTGYNPVKGYKVEIPNIQERFQFRGGGYNPANWGKYVTRLMWAADAFSYAGLKEMRSYEVAMNDARKLNKDAITPTKGTWALATELLNKTSERVAIAEQTAKDEGLTGNEYKRRVWELMEQGRGKAMVEDAAHFAARGTFNYVPEGMLGMLTEFVSSITQGVAADIKIPFSEKHITVRPTKFIIPFTRIIANVTNMALDYYPPIGLGRAAIGSIGLKGFEKSHFATKFYRKYTPEERQKVLIKAMIGVAAQVGFYLLTQPDDEGEAAVEITANGYGDYQKNYELKELGWQPYSIKLGDKWYSYQYTPLLLALAPLGYLRDNQKYNKQKVSEETLVQQIGLAYFMGLAVINDMTWASSLNSLTDAMKSKEPSQAKAYITNLVTSSAKGFIYPKLAEQITQLIDAAQKNPRRDAKDLMGKVMRDIPIARNKYNIMLNAVGEPVIFDPFQMTSPVKTDPFWEYVIERNITIGKPDAKRVFYDDITKTERGMTDQEYYDFVRLSGPEIKRRVEQEVMSKKMSDDDAREAVTKIKTDVRALTMTEMFGWGEFRTSNPKGWEMLMKNEAIQIPVNLPEKGGRMKTLTWRTDEGETITADRDEVQKYNEVAMNAYYESMVDYLSEEPSKTEISEATGNLLYYDTIKKIWSKAKRVATADFKDRDKKSN